MKICLLLVLCSSFMAEAFSSSSYVNFNSPRYSYSRSISSQNFLQPSNTFYNRFRTPVQYSPVQRTFQPSSSVRQSPVSSSCSSAFCKTFGVNLDEKARFEYDRQYPKMIALSKHPRTARIIQDMVDSNPCLDDLESYGALIEVGVAYIEANAREIEEAFMTTLSLRGEKDPATLFEKYADVVAKVDEVWAEMGPLKCEGSTVGVFSKASRDMAFAFDKLSKVEVIPGILTPDVKKTMGSTARGMFALANAADNFDRAQQSLGCDPERLEEYDELSAQLELNAVAVDELGNVWASIGGYTNAQELRDTANFLRSLETSLKDWPVEATTEESCRGGQLERAVLRMKELSQYVRRNGASSLGLRLDLL